MVVGVSVYGCLEEARDGVVETESGGWHSENESLTRSKAVAFTPEDSFVAVITPALGEVLQLLRGGSPICSGERRASDARWLRSGVVRG